MYGINPDNLKITIEFGDSTFVFDKILDYNINSELITAYQDCPSLNVNLNFSLDPKNYSITEKKVSE